MSGSWLAGALGAAALAYGMLAAWSWRAFARRRPATSAWQPPVTVLKPLCGDEPLLYETLRSFFVQDYPSFQIVFGVQSASDGALPVVTRLRRAFPTCDVDLVISGPAEGLNLKIANLMAMQSAARHDVLVIADSDIQVGPDYLRRVVAPLADANVGAVTCPYVGRAARPSLVNRLACLHIHDEFLPAVLVARRLGERAFCLGSTIALRRASLARIGGFEALGDVLADDYEIGARLGRAGLRIELSECLVETIAAEASLSTLMAHELRWARTLRAVRPWGYAFSWLTLPFAVSLIAGALLLPTPGHGALALAVVAGGLGLRIGLNSFRARTLRLPAEPWLAPLRDVLSFAVWIASYGSRDVVWRGERLSVDDTGRLQAPKARRRSQAPDAPVSGA